MWFENEPGKCRIVFKFGGLETERQLDTQNPGIFSERSIQSRVPRRRLDIRHEDRDKSVHICSSGTSSPMCSLVSCKAADSSQL